MASDAKPPPILFNEAQLRHAVLDTMSRREESWDPTDGGKYTLDEGAAAIAACNAAGLPHTLAPFLAYSHRFRRIVGPLHPLTPWWSAPRRAARNPRSTPPY